MNQNFFQLIPKSHQAVGGDSCGTETQPLVLVVLFSAERETAVLHCNVAFCRAFSSQPWTSRNEPYVIHKRRSVIL